jgi:hypothetical protein
MALVKKDKVISSLDALLTSDVKRTKIGRIREVFDEIKSKQEFGVSLDVIFKTLNADGFGLKNISSLRYFLWKIGAERGFETVEKTPKSSSTKKIKAVNMSPKKEKEPNEIEKIKEEKADGKPAEAGKVLSSDEIKALSKKEIDINDYQ